MRLKKYIDVSIDIQNCINIYAHPNRLLEIVKNKFEHKCLRQCLIISVDNIIKQSECIITSDGAPNFGTINLSLEVTAIIYNPGDLIVGAKVITKNSEGFMILSTENVNMMMANNQSTNSIKEEQLVIVEVVDSRYNIGAEKIVANVILPTPVRPKAYKIISQPNLEFPLIKKIREELENELKWQRDLFKENNKEIIAAWSVLSEILFGAIDNSDTHNRTKIDDVLQMLNTPDIFNQGSVILIQGPNLLSDQIQISTNTSEKIKIISTLEPTAVIYELISSCANNLRIMREVIQVYTINDNIEKNMNIWKIIKAMKAEQ